MPHHNKMTQLPFCELREAEYLQTWHSSKIVLSFGSEGNSKLGQYINILDLQAGSEIFLKVQGINLAPYAPEVKFQAIAK